MDIESRTFSKLFIENQSRFVRFANSYVRDWATAEDMVSEAIMYFWENRERLPNDKNVPAYILTVIKNKCLNHLQHILVKENVFADMNTHAQWGLEVRIASCSALEPTELYAKEILDIMNKTLIKLPDKTRIVFRKSRFDKLSNKEIAENMDISVKTVEAHITTAIKVLRVALGDYFVLCLSIFFIFL